MRATSVGFMSADVASSSTRRYTWFGGAISIRFAIATLSVLSRKKYGERREQHRSGGRASLPLAGGALRTAREDMECHGLA